MFANLLGHDFETEKFVGFFSPRFNKNKKFKFSVENSLAMNYSCCMHLKRPKYTQN